MKLSTFFTFTLIFGLSVYWGYEVLISESRITHSYILVAWSFSYPIIFDLLGMIRRMEKPTLTREIMSGLINRKGANFHNAVFYLFNLLASLIFVGLVNLFL